VTPEQVASALAWLGSTEFVMVARGLRLTRREAIRMKLGAALRAIASDPARDITELFAADIATLRNIADDETEHIQARAAAIRILGG
jgi:hypothetical protein